MRSASENFVAPKGAIMNSCTSTELSACAPPLMMFIMGRPHVADDVLGDVESVDAVRDAENRDVRARVGVEPVERNEIRDVEREDVCRHDVFDEELVREPPLA